MLDTGDFYGLGHNEMLIAEALRSRSAGKVAISVKFGAQRGPDGAWLGFDARPGGGEDLARLQPEASGRRGDRHLQAGAPRPECADRRDGRRRSRTW